MIVNKIATNGTVSVTTASIEVLAENDRRRYALITNSGTNGVWLSLGVTAVVGTGIWLPGGGSFVMDGDNLWRGTVNGIATAGTDVLGTVELK